MIKKVNGNEQLHKYFNEMKTKKYFTSTDVMKMTGISLRTLRYRITELKEKYSDVQSLLFMKKNKWMIHNNIVREFLPKYQPRWQNLYNIDWVSFITWATKNNYELVYHKQLVDELSQSCPHQRFYYVLERTEKGNYHAHLLSTGSIDEINTATRCILDKYIEKNEFRLEVSDINDKVMVINYLQKDKHDERLY